MIKDFFIADTKITIGDKLKVTYAYPPYFEKETITGTLTSVELGTIKLADKYPLDTKNIISIVNLTAEENKKNQYIDIESPETLGDCMTCPECESEDTYIYNTDEKELEEDSTKGHLFAQCQCRKCGNFFSTYVFFDYKITKAYIQK